MVRNPYPPGNGISRIDLWNNVTEHSIYNGYYDDQNEDIHSSRAQIQSDIITGNTIRLFVVARADIEEDIREAANFEVNPSATAGEISSDILEAIDNYYDVYLDDTLLPDLNWKFHYKVSTGQKGYLTYLDISDLEIGLHSIKIRSSVSNNRQFANIMFYRER